MDESACRNHELRPFKQSWTVGVYWTVTILPLVINDGVALWSCSTRTQLLLQSFPHSSPTRVSLPSLRAEGSQSFLQLCRNALVLLPRRLPTKVVAVFASLEAPLERPRCNPSSGPGAASWNQTCMWPSTGMGYFAV